MLRNFGAALVALVILDGIWLGVVMPGFYRRHLAHLARMADGRLDPLWPVAALVYPVIALGLTLFVLSRARTPLETMVYGACFGAITFAVYDLTNQATLRDWPAILTLVDIGWGALSCGLASGTAALLDRHA
jgi:uncharacterized membrane protein